MAEQDDIARLEAKVDALSTQIQDLVQAWNTARGMVRFVKLLGGMATAVTAIWALIRLGKGA